MRGSERREGGTLWVKGGKLFSLLLYFEAEGNSFFLEKSRSRWKREREMRDVWPFRKEKTLLTDCIQRTKELKLRRHTNNDLLCGLRSFVLSSYYEISIFFTLREHDFLAVAMWILSLPWYRMEIGNIRLGGIDRTTLPNRILFFHTELGGLITFLFHLSIVPTPRPIKSLVCVSLVKTFALSLSKAANFGRYMSTRS